MALTRKLLKALGLEDEKIDQIIDAHTETVDALKKERDDAKALAESAGELTRERDSLKAEVDRLKQAGGDAAKVQADFDAFKAQVETEKANRSKTAAVKAALKEAGVGRDEFIELLMGKVDLAKVEMDGEKVKDTAWLEPMKTAYAGCFGKVNEGGLPGANPPGGGASPSREQLNAMSDADYYAATYGAKK